MPYKIELTWHAPRKCWKKFYRGQTYYVGKGACKGRSDIEGYRTAWAEWLERKRKLDGQNSNQATITPTTRELAHAVAFATDYSSVRFDPPSVTAESIADRRIDRLIEIFLRDKRARMENGQLTPKMYEQYRSKLADFNDFGVSRSIYTADQIDANAVGQYQRMQLHLSS